MKKTAMAVSLLVFFEISLWSFEAQALQFSVVGPCDANPSFQAQVSAVSKKTSLGDLTIQVLTDHRISFQGDRSGVKSIDGSPVGDEALQVLSDSQMRAYGWCVAVDGKQPDRMPDEVVIGPETQEIIWFYAFAFYDRGEWKNFCTPAHLDKPIQFCPIDPKSY